jgi:hypothetical protein
VTPARLRAYVLIVTRDIVPPIVGAFLTVYLPLTHQFAYWQLPLLAGLFGVPLVAASRDGETTPEPMPEARPEPEFEQSRET